MCFRYWLCVVLSFSLWQKSDSFSDIFKDTNPPTTIAELEAKILNLVNYVLKQAFPLTVRTISESNVSQSCTGSLLRLFLDMKVLDKSAMKMLDASAKPPASMLHGTLTVFGGYDECLDILVKNTKQKVIYEGQYCLIELRLPDFVFRELKELNSTGLISSIWEEFREYVALGDEFAFRSGVCVPSKCSAQDVRQVIQLATKSFGIKPSVKCQIKTKIRPNTEQIVFICCFILILLIIIIGTIVDVLGQFTTIRMKPGETKRFLIAFSFYSNTIRLFSTRQNDSSLAAIRGCRVFSAFWIILGHTYFFPHVLHFLKYRRLIGLSEFIGELMFKTVTNATVAIDTFFVISGMLLVYTSWKKLEKNKGWINPFTFFPSRMIRILPAQLLVIALFMILPLLGNGPIWNETFEESYDACKKNWWTNILFIQNFWPIERICLFHTWFIGALFQIIIVTFVLLLILYRWPKMGIFLIVLLVISSSTLIALLTSKHNLPSFFSLLEQDVPTWRRYFNIIYSRPYTYISSYTIGMLLGYVYVAVKRPRIKPMTRAITWLIATTAALTVLYGVYMFKIDTNRSLHLAYAALHRPVWSLSISWILYACLNGYGGIISRFLSWHGLIPLDRMIFLAYLIHPLVMFYYTARTRAVIYMAHVEQVYIYLATLVITLCLSYIFNVTFEQPSKYIETFIIRKLSRKKSPIVVPATILIQSFPKCPEITITPPESTAEECNSHL